MLKKEKGDSSLMHILDIVIICVVLFKLDPIFLFFSFIKSAFLSDFFTDKIFGTRGVNI